MDGGLAMIGLAAPAAIIEPALIERRLPLLRNRL